MPCPSPFFTHERGRIGGCHPQEVWQGSVVRGAQHREREMSSASTWSFLPAPCPPCLTFPCTFPRSSGVSLNDGAFPKAVCSLHVATVTWKVAACDSMDTSASVPGDSPRDLSIASGDFTVSCLALTRARH